jgi:hypothetical protein
VGLAQDREKSEYAGEVAGLFAGEDTTITEPSPASVQQVVSIGVDEITVESWAMFVAEAGSSFRSGIPL